MDEKHCCPSKTDTGLHTYWSITKWNTKNFPSPCGIRQLWGMSLWWRKSWFCVGSYLGIFVDLDHNHLPLMAVTYLKMKQRLPLGQSTLHILKSKFYPLEKKHKLINCKWYLRKTRIWRESELSPQKIQQVSKIGVLKARRKILQLFCGRKKSVGMLCDVAAGLNMEGYFLLSASKWHNAHVKPWSKNFRQNPEILKWLIESLDFLSKH